MFPSAVSVSSRASLTTAATSAIINSSRIMASSSASKQLILPKQMTAKNPSFAYFSIRDRIPKIVTGVVDKLYKYHHKAVEKHGPKAGEDVNSIIAKLSELRYRISTDKPLEPIAEELSDAKDWNTELANATKDGPENKVTWYSGPWMFNECYMYRRIHQFFQQTQFMRDFDPFMEDKENGYRDSSKYMIAIGTELVKEFDKKLSRDELREMVLRLLQISLWGNKADLSLTGGDPHFMSDTIFHELEHLRPSILADDLDKVVDNYLLKKQKQIDVILDNSGLELFMDLCLCDFLVTKELVSKVILHGKEYPWFVSDTMQKDLNWIIKQLSSETDQYLSTLGKRWRNYIETGIFKFHAHPFWTQSFDYSRMKEKAPELYQQLATSSLLIFKGDMNYRKLVGDRDWPHQTLFSKALCGFTPAPLMTLRTLKAETVAGLPSESIRLIKEKFGETDLSWMSSSDYAVVQLCEPHQQ